MYIALVGAEFEENLALRYIRSALERAGHTVEQIAFNEKDQLEAAAAKLARSKADLAGFSMVFTYRAGEFAALASRARQLRFRGHLTAGGHFATFNAENLLKDVSAFDSVVCGEGEEIMCDLAANIATLNNVKGLIWRDAAGRILRNSPATKPPDLDRLAFPTHRFPPDRCHGMGMVNMLASRGCTHACAFCSISAWHKLCGGQRFRMRSPAQIAEEMAQLYARGVRIFNFHDDNFVLSDKEKMFDRIKDLRRQLQQRGVVKIAFAIKSRPDDVDEELFSYLKSMGLFRVFLGIEAGTTESLTRLGRGQAKSDNEKALEIVNRLDIHACFNLLMLNPDSTLEDFAANVAFLRAHPHNPMNFCRTEIYAGTPLEARLRRENRLLGDYWAYDYEIADPRAQDVFQIVHPAFRQRNYGESCLHHTGMRVDFEHQLLTHFWSDCKNLRQQTKDFIVSVNSNTCQYLEEVVSEVDRGFAHRAELREFSENLKHRLDADNRRLSKIGQQLLWEIRLTALRKSTKSKTGLARKVAAAGLAVTLLAGATGCKWPWWWKCPGTVIFETIAAPPPQDTQAILDVLGIDVGNKTEP